MHSVQCTHFPLGVALPKPVNPTKPPKSSAKMTSSGLVGFVSACPPRLVVGYFPNSYVAIPSKTVCTPPYSLALNPGFPLAVVPIRVAPCVRFWEWRFLASGRAWTSGSLGPRFRDAECYRWMNNSLPEFHFKLFGTMLSC